MSDSPFKTRVLFVDDEPLVLQGLQRMLRPMRSEWDMAFVENGAEALRAMGDIPFQVVVSDMRMPGMNGAQLLAQIKDQHPKTVRIILSGHADKELIMQCVGTAHQFIAKPCDPESLRTAITRAREFDASVKNERMKQLIAQMDCLPSIPSVMNEIVEQLQREDCSLEAIGAIISKDIAMTAKLLKLVNSAFFGLRREISSPEDAVSYLGLETIKSLVLAVNAFSTFESRKTGPISLEQLWRHSLEVASGAREIARDAGVPKAIAEESFIAGMLHDIGKLALAANLPEEYAKVFASAEALGLSLHAAEEAAFGAHHADLGGYLLSLWGLPVRVVDAITLHHEPLRQGKNEFTPLAAVHIADALSHARGAERIEECHLLNWPFLEFLGLAEKVEDWRELIHGGESNPVC